MIKRTFFTSQEAVSAFDGDSPLLAELIELHGLRMYHHFSHVCSMHLDDGDFEDSLCSSGEHHLGNWMYLMGVPNPGDLSEIVGRYYLTGWFQLDRKNSMHLFSGAHEFNPSPASFKDGERIGYFYQLQIEKIFSFDARFLVADIETYREKVSCADQNATPNHSLDKRERITLLNIIGALAESANVDLSKPHKAGEAISAMLDAKGVKVSPRTVGEHLKAVRDAMDSRKV